MVETSPKKKRKVDSSPSPKKNRHIRIQVETSHATDNPIVVSFPGGLPEGLLSNARSNAPLPDFHWEKLSKKSSSGRKVVGKDKNCTYTSSAAGLGFDDRRTKLCVGVYDKRNGTVVIREAASRGTVFSLQQSIPSYLEKNGPIQFKAGQNLLTYSAQVYEDFGSAKKRKVLKSQAANRVEISNVVGAGKGSVVMQQVIQGEAMSESNRKAVAESHGDEDGPSAIGYSSKAINAAHDIARRKFLPLFDEYAVKPHKVYSARDIAGDEGWKRVYNKVHACMHDNDPTDSVIAALIETDWFPSVLKLVKEINAESEDSKDRYTCAILTNHVIRFYQMNHKRKSIPPVNLTKAKYFGLPVEVASRFIELFTTAVPGADGNMAHVMSKQDKDKTVVHALLLSMMAHGVAMTIPNLKPVAEDLKVPVNDCAQMLRLAGCQVKKNGTTTSAVLKTPLTFPPPKRAVNRN